MSETVFGSHFVSLSDPCVKVKDCSNYETTNLYYYVDDQSDDGSIVPTCSYRDYSLPYFKIP